MKNVKMVALCYDITDPHSFYGLRDYWFVKDEKYSWYPRILIGNKLDLNYRCVSYEEGLALSKEIGAATFFECSAKTGENIKEIFRTAAEIILKKISNNDVNSSSNFSFSDKEPHKSLFT